MHEIVNELLNAKEVYVTYNMQKTINIKLDLSDKELSEVKDMFSYNFFDINDFWVPQDKSKND